MREFLQYVMKSGAGELHTEVLGSSCRERARLLCGKWFTDLAITGFGLDKGIPTSGSVQATSLLWF